MVTHIGKALTEPKGTRGKVWPPHLTKTICSGVFFSRRSVNSLLNTGVKPRHCGEGCTRARVSIDARPRSLPRDDNERAADMRRRTGGHQWAEKYRPTTPAPASASEVGMVPFADTSEGPSFSAKTEAAIAREWSERSEAQRGGQVKSHEKSLSKNVERGTARSAGDCARRAARAPHRGGTTCSRHFTDSAARTHSNVACSSSFACTLHRGWGANHHSDRLMAE